ncbi:hypothetical protein E4U55_000690, partial [Claviceps digitariae]
MTRQRQPYRPSQAAPAAPARCLHHLVGDSTLATSFHVAFLHLRQRIKAPRPQHPDMSEAGEMRVDPARAQALISQLASVRDRIGALANGRN